MVPVATLHDEETKANKAHAVPLKGNVEAVADDICRDLEAMGRGEDTDLIVKCDQENALGDLVKEIRGRRKGRTVIENAKARDSASYGTIERNIQSADGIVRTMKLHLEKRIGPNIPATHPVMNWLVEHGADTPNRFHVGKDGRTPYERINGKSYKGHVVELGRTIYHKTPGKVRGGSMEARWQEGVWLGRRWASDEHLIATDQG